VTEDRLESAFRFTHGHRIRYDEVDAQGIVGNATWLALLQLGRTEYLRYMGILLEGGSRTPVQAVVRQAAVEYLAPARFDDPIVIRVRTSAISTRSSTVEYIVDNDETGLRCIVGQTVLVCLEMATFRSMPWPQVWRERIADFEGEHLRGR
jgi:acyl-CoA thioester hydrolase